MSFTLGVADGDIDFNVHGRPVIVYGADKGSQDLAQIQTSKYDPNRNYGTRAEPGFVPAVAGDVWLSTELALTVERLQALQASARNTTADERIAAVDKIDVTSRDDRTSLDYELVVSTAAKDDITVSGNVRRRRMSMGHLSA